MRPDAEGAAGRHHRQPEVYKKIVGMQMLVEGLAMGAFATVFN
jgi:hypothetical protein